MYPINWIDNTGWGIGRFFSEKRKRVSVVLNTAVNNYQKGDLNLFVYSEPPEIIGGIDQYCLRNKNKYDFILTWDEKILNDCAYARKMLYIDPWITDEFVLKEKYFELSFLRGAKSYAYGHQFRWQVFKNADRLNIPKKFYDSVPFDKNIRQSLLFSNNQFNLSIENSQHNNYFTEKILDCFLTKTIPVYWGCPNIGNFFNMDGILYFRDFPELERIINSLSENYYQDHFTAVEENYNLTKEITKDIGEAGYKIMDRMIDKCLEEKFGPEETNQ
jgi:hypothetical protein